MAGDLAHDFVGAGLVEDDPDSELRIDLAEGGILLPDGTTVEFDVDTFAKLMLLRGTDEIGYLVDKLPDIEAWEADHPARVDTRPDEATAGPIA